MIKHFCDLCGGSVYCDERISPIKYVLPAVSNGKDAIQKDAELCHRCYDKIKVVVESLRVPTA